MPENGDLKMKISMPHIAETVGSHRFYAINHHTGHCTEWCCQLSELAYLSYIVHLEWINMGIQALFSGIY